MFFNIVIAGAITLPTLVAGSIRTDDYPGEALRSRDGGGSVSVFIQVDPTGSVESCSPRLSGTIPILEKKTCELIEQRFRFEPARNQTGQPITAVVVQSIKWVRGSARERFYNLAEMVLKVKTLPKRFNSGDILEIALLTGKDGSITACQSKQEADFPALTKVACQQARAAFKPSPIKNRAGEPVEAVRVIRVRFDRDSG